MKKLLLALLLPFAAAQAKDIAACSVDSPINSSCRVPIAQLHPTQAGIGLLQVEDEVADLKGKSDKKLDKLAEKKVIPVVLATQADGSVAYYLVDRHHLTSALWRIGAQDTVVKVLARLPYDANFWPTMAQKHWAWLKDEKGNAIQPTALPQRIADLSNYPYRSLAGMLQDDDYIDKSQSVYFVEFAWAQWLGQQMNWQPITRANIKTKLKEAKRLACLPAAKSLPGYASDTCGI